MIDDDSFDDLSFEEVLEQHGGQRIYTDSIDDDSVPYMCCVLCGDKIYLEQGQEYPFFCNGAEALLAHGTCAARMFDLLKEVAKDADRQDHRYDPSD